MRKIIAGAFVSLDGVMQAPGGPEEDPTGGFQFGGWTVPYWHDAIGEAVAEYFARPFDLLLGRRTYDIFAATWPYVETNPQGDSFDKVSARAAETFNRVTKYVATHSPATLTWKNSSWLGEDIIATLERLKAGDGPDLLIQGSSGLIQQLLANDLIDEVRLLIYPLVLGKGKPFFGEGTIPAAFRCTKSVTAPNGVLIANYERAGEVATGSVAMETPTNAELERRKNLT
jgi:dihydrofolate reductase